MSTDMFCFEISIFSLDQVSRMSKVNSMFVSESALYPAAKTFQCELL